MSKKHTQATNPWLTLPQLVNATNSKKVVFWGSSDLFTKTMMLFEFNVAFFVDSAPGKQGEKVFYGYDVFPPQKLKELKNNDNYYIIITAGAFYEVIDALENYGFRAGEEFAVTPILKNAKIIEDILSHKQQVLLSSSDAKQDKEDRGGGLYLYDIPSCTMEKKFSGVTRGFDSHKNNYFVVDHSGGVKILDKKFKEVDSFELPKNSNPHGLVVDKKNELIYVVLCLQDKINVYDLNTFKLVRSITLSDKHKKTGLCHHHINDICLDGNSLYVSVFSKSGNGHREVFDGAILEYDLEKDMVVEAAAENLWLPHSVRIINGKLAYLDSMRGNLHVTEHKTETHINGFARGLDFDGKYYYIGQSLNRYFDRMAGYSNNISMDCGFFLFDNTSKACKLFPTLHLRDINTLRLLKPFRGII